MPHKILRAALAISIVAPASACAVLDPTSPPPTQNSRAVADQYTPAVPAPVLHEGVCIDPSLSTVPSFAQSIVSNLATAVGGWTTVSPLSSPHTPSEVPQPGLDLQVRLVVTNSFSSSAPVVPVFIPAVPGLTPRLDATEPDFIDNDQKWRGAKDEVTRLAADASVAAQRGADAIRAISLIGQTSEIAGCLSALAVTVPPDHRALVVASDLEQNEPPQIAGDLHGTRILIIQPCGGDAARCAALEMQWRQELTARGAEPIEFIRPENATADRLKAFMKGQTP